MISRRRFLAGMGTAGVASLLYLDPVRHFLNAFVRGRIQDGRTRHLNNRLTAHPARNYVQFNLYGAPSRWVFDHPLRPNDTDGFLAAPGVYNRFQQLDLSRPHL